MNDTTKPRERPILFSGPMVRAILAGTKTVTRRLAKKMGVVLEGVPFEGLGKGAHALGEHGSPVACPYGVRGDRLWVRETWCDADVMYGEGGNECASVVGYAADKSAIQYDAPKPCKIPAYDIGQWNWSKLKMRPSTSLPRWAARITLEIVSARVERLQDITEEDARAEGLTRENVPPLLAAADRKRNWPIARNDQELFALGWDAINGKRAPWSTNPWVWVVTFRRL